ncbi:MAG: hypothetical protein GON13_03085 [Nanoarchaeota archaeon]|nr:hypothetical protein [Nanoarchaeota archaeon]
MKKTFLIMLTFMYVSSGMSFEMNVKLLKKTIEPGNDILLSITLENLQTENVTLNYSIEQLDGTLFATSEEISNVREKITIRKTIGTLYEPGIYQINVLGTSDNQEKNFTNTLNVVVDCISFTGISNSYTLPNQTQDYAFTLINTCEIDLHNITIFFQEKNYSIQTLENNQTIRMNNVTSPTQEKNIRLTAKYIEGSSERIIEFRIRTQQEINKLVGELINSTAVIINKTQANLKLILLSDKTGIKTKLETGLSIINQAMQEYELQNYALSIRYLLESVPTLREANKESNEAVTQQIMIILILATPILGIILITIYNRYRQALKTKQLEELGKS